MTYLKLTLRHKKAAGVVQHNWTKVSFVTDNPNYARILVDPDGRRKGVWTVRGIRHPFEGLLMHAVPLSPSSRRAMNLDGFDWWSVSIAALDKWLTPDLETSDGCAAKVEFWTSHDSINTAFDVHSWRAMKEGIPRSIAKALNYGAMCTLPPGTFQPGKTYEFKVEPVYKELTVDKKRPYVLVIGGRFGNVNYTLKEAQEAATKHVQSHDDVDVVILKAVSKVRRQPPKVEVIAI